MRKWASNSTALLKDIDPSDHGLAGAKELLFDDSIKVLSLSWNQGRYAFHFHISIKSDPGSTKRAILAAVARFTLRFTWGPPFLSPPKLYCRNYGYCTASGMRRSPWIFGCNGETFMQRFFPWKKSRYPSGRDTETKSHDASYMSSRQRKRMRGHLLAHHPIGRLSGNTSVGG